MFDALGVRNLKISESIDFLSSIDRILDRQREHVRRFKHVLSSNSEKDIDYHFPEFHVFGDTLILIWDLSNQDTNKHSPILGTHSLSLAWVVIDALQEDVYLRGAVSIGEYCSSNQQSEDATVNSVIGPAVADAAYWMEQADWIGAMATPNCGRLLDKLHDEERGSAIQYWLKYPVPRKNNSPISLWAIGWPGLMLVVDNLREDSAERGALGFLSKKIRKSNMTLGTETKYLNTETFVSFILLNFEAYFGILEKEVRERLDAISFDE